MTISYTGDLILSEGLVNETFLGTNHYTKTESDGLYQGIEDVNNPYATNAQITALTNSTNQALGLYTTTADLNTLLANKADTTAIPRRGYWIYRR